LPGNFHGQRSLVGHSPWAGQRADTTKWLTLSLFSDTVKQHLILSFFCKWKKKPVSLKLKYLWKYCYLRGWGGGSIKLNLN